MKGISPTPRNKSIKNCDISLFSNKSANPTKLPLKMMMEMILHEKITKNVEINYFWIKFFEKSNTLFLTSNKVSLKGSSLTTFTIWAVTIKNIPKNNAISAINIIKRIAATIFAGYWK